MSAEILRRAAALMRERAGAARAGRWDRTNSMLVPDGMLVVAPRERGRERVATCTGSLPEGNRANAEHIASWHPAVALAVADWLDHAAARAESKIEHGGKPEAVWSHERDALAVARAYLGEPA